MYGLERYLDLQNARQKNDYVKYFSVFIQLSPDYFPKVAFWILQNTLHSVNFTIQKLGFYYMLHTKIENFYKVVLFR